MTIQLAYQRLLAQLYNIYKHREAANIADLTIEHVTAQRKIDRILYKNLPLTSTQEQTLLTLTQQLLKHKPVQYVLGEAWFCNMKLYVDENVLIPRPETEELVEWIVHETRSGDIHCSKMIDTGTGSGCIAIALKKKLHKAEVDAIDVSAEAIEVAKRNALEQNVDVRFFHANFLDETHYKHLSYYDVIVSNPPYVKKSEENTMQANVLQYEPHVALFVPDDDALKFYKAIAMFGKSNLNQHGNIYVEINEALAQDVVTLFADNGYKNVVLKKDMQGKDRMIKASNY